MSTTAHILCAIDVISRKKKILIFFTSIIGRQIALENPDIEQEMIQAVEEVHQSGEAMSSTAREFATDPCSSAKRGNMVRALFIYFEVIFYVKTPAQKLCTSTYNDEEGFLAEKSLKKSLMNSHPLQVLYIGV